MLLWNGNPNSAARLDEALTCLGFCPEVNRLRRAWKSSARWFVVHGIAAMALFWMCASMCTAQSGSSEAAGAALSAGASSAAASESLAVWTNDPIYPGEVVHVNIYDAPDFSTSAIVSSAGEIGIPYYGPVHIAGLNSETAGKTIAETLQKANLLRNPRILVLVDSSSAGITVLGEVKAPGIYEPAGKHLLSDVLAMAGGITTNAGRLIEVSSETNPEKRVEIPWDPTLHNTDVYDRVILPGQRIVVKPCGFVYVGGNVGKPGAYTFCGSRDMTLSKIIAVAGAISLNSTYHKVLIIRRNPDGTRVVHQIDMGKVQVGKAPDPPLEEDDIVYVPLSRIKTILFTVPNYVEALSSTALYIYHPG